MIYNEEKSSGLAFPLIVILLAMAAIIGSLFMTADSSNTTRVWVPASSAGI
ncbi:hypothetical protein JNB88_27720 [Rhizobium cauense]|uniref:hypothetical protein n=1 Tax=Rhizobium cauense TaxID=1166683 RepID=UPI001C6E3AB2|nr:hypothetical protein [Rhizobium cauense]MBW9117414.1 hypothetical protein [Rhizobium cauense]